MTDHIEHVEIALTDELLGIRRQLHRHPERSFKEFETSRRLHNLLESHGITVLDNPLDTGVIGEIKGDHDGSQIGLLPISTRCPCTRTPDSTSRPRTKGSCMPAATTSI